MSAAEPELMTIFAEALERTDPAARAAYLDAACAGDAALRRRVEELLDAHEGAGRFLEGDPTSAPESGPFPSVGETEASPSAAPLSSQSVTEGNDPDGTRTSVERRESVHPTVRPMSGQVIASRYTLREVLGEGGMGTVYLAEQTRPVKRKVALKLIRLGMDSRAVLARFDAERQALALMDHPNIARVYDGGTTEAAQPFFVMELVQGEPITEYCDRMRLPVRARLELFVAVCQAVQHAHQKGIIHRDLKPGNILVAEVDGRPTPKVIDFGVAKAVTFQLTDQSLADTGAIVGTPTYMSPEQADPTAMDIDTRTDIYALGVILYELLAGSPPIDAKQFRRGAFLEMLRMVREVDPPRPSTKVSTSEALPNIAANRGIEPEHLKRALRGDLDWMVMKALEKDRTRRYETANGFAADILRHLANEPVLAAPPSRAYRMRKFVRKHRAAVIAVSLVLLALVGGMVGTSLGLLEARRQEGLAVAAQKAEKARAESESNERQRALQAEAETRKKADELELRLDNSNFLLAVAAYDSNDIPGVRARLDGIQVKNRGWEWHYLRRECIGGLFTLYGHTGAVNSVAFSPDGTRIATGSDDRTARVWDAQTGTPLLELEGHRGQVKSASFSPDGTRVLTGSTDQAAKVWDARTGTTLLDLKGHTGAVNSVAFSPDGTRIFTGSDDRTAKVWDARSGTPLLELKGHTGAVNSAAFIPDGTRIVTGSSGAYTTSRGEAKVWDARSGTLLLELKGHAGAVNSAAFSPDGTRIVTGSVWVAYGSTDQTTARVWDARTGAPLLDLTGHRDNVGSVAFSPDGTRIVTGSRDQTTRIWDARSGTLMLQLNGFTSEVFSVAFSPDGTRIVTGTRDMTAKVWDARTGTPKVEHKLGEAILAFSPGGTRIVTVCTDGRAKVWDAQTGVPLLELKGHAGAVNSAAFSADGTRIVTGGREQTAKVWDARTGVPLLVLKGDASSLWFSADGTRIFSGGHDGTAKMLDARTGAPLLVLKGGTGKVWSVAFSPDGTRVVAGGDDWTAKVWDARTGAPLLALRGHTGHVLGVAFSADGTRIVTGSDDRTAKVWDARTGAPLLALKGSPGSVMRVSFNPNDTRIVTGIGNSFAGVVEDRFWDAQTGRLVGGGGLDNWVRSVVFSADGTRIVTGGRDGRANMWDARTGAPLLELNGHTGQVLSVAFSPDGERIVTGSGDHLTSRGEAKVWDARTGTPLLELKGHTSEVLSVAFSPDGTRIVSGSADRSAKIWDARGGGEALTLKGHTGYVRSAAFSPDGARIVTGSGDFGEGFVETRVWDARTGTPLLVLKGHTSQVRSVAFSPDGTRIVTGGRDGRANMWDARTGAPLLALKGHTGQVRSVAFSPDGTRIVTGSGDYLTSRGEAKVWDARTGAPLLDLKAPAASVAFSPDGTRIVTGSGDYLTSRREAKVWDARTGAPLLELKGHAAPVSSVAFSPDGARILTGSEDRTAKVWDARTGTPLLELKGHTSSVSSVEFVPDGTRIVTRNSQGTAKVWDARTGEELKDEPIPPATRPAQISPNGRRIAHIAGESVELVPLQPDEEELAYRKFLMKPDFRFYRASYDAARASKDAFLTRFYLSLFPPAEQSRIRAEEIVLPLFARLSLREAVIAALKAQPTSDTVLQAACLELAETRPLSAQECNNAAWPLVRASGQPEAMYQRGLRLAETACRLEPDHIGYFNTLGVAQYRAGLMAEALATLSRSCEWNQDYPGALPFLALAQHRLGQFEKARDTLARLREVMKLATDPESGALLREAETIELDRAFPADPFAR
jgi:WD40 repeat protein